MVSVREGAPLPIACRMSGSTAVGTAGFAGGLTPPSGHALLGVHSRYVLPEVKVPVRVPFPEVLGYAPGITVHTILAEVSTDISDVTLQERIGLGV